LDMVGHNSENELSTRYLNLANAEEQEMPVNIDDEIIELGEEPKPDQKEEEDQQQNISMKDLLLNTNTRTPPHPTDFSNSILNFPANMPLQNIAHIAENAVGTVCPDNNATTANCQNSHVPGLRISHVQSLSEMVDNIFDASTKSATPAHLTTQNVQRQYQSPPTIPSSLEITEILVPQTTSQLPQIKEVFSMNQNNVQIEDNLPPAKTPTTATEPVLTAGPFRITPQMQNGSYNIDIAFTDPQELNSSNLSNAMEITNSNANANEASSVLTPNKLTTPSQSITSRVLASLNAKKLNSSSSWAANYEAIAASTSSSASPLAISASVRPSTVSDRNSKLATIKATTEEICQKTGLPSK